MWAERAPAATSVSALLGKGAADGVAARRLRRGGVLRPIEAPTRRLMMSGSRGGVATARLTYPLLSCALHESAHPAYATDRRVGGVLR